MVLCKRATCNRQDFLFGFFARKAHSTKMRDQGNPIFVGVLTRSISLFGSSCSLIECVPFGVLFTPMFNTCIGFVTMLIAPFRFMLPIFFTIAFTPLLVFNQIVVGGITEPGTFNTMLPVDISHCRSTLTRFSYIVSLAQFCSLLSRRWISFVNSFWHWTCLLYIYFQRNC
jgi:hypothetical protein